MKRKLGKIIIVVVLLLCALFISPKEIYYNYRAEKEAHIIRGLLIEGIEDKRYEIKNIKYLSGNEFLVETDSDKLLVKLKGDKWSTYYDFYKYGFSIERFSYK